MPPASRITDMHTCPMVAPGPCPHVGGPIISGEPTVIIGFMPAARVSDKAVCCCGVDSVAMGSPTVIIGNQMAARIGDPTAHGGVVVAGFPTVLIGNSGSGGASPSPAAAAFKNAAENGTPMVCKGPCEACGQM